MKAIGLNTLNSGEGTLSNSMLYRMEELRLGLEAIAETMPEKMPGHNEAFFLG